MSVHISSPLSDFSKHNQRQSGKYDCSTPNNRYLKHMSTMRVASDLRNEDSFCGGKRSFGDASEIDNNNYEYEASHQQKKYRISSPHKEQLHPVNTNDIFEQRKQAELAKLRHAFEQEILKREQCNAKLHEENTSQKNTMEAYRKEIEKLSSENKLLKRGISIQNQQKETVQQEAATLKTLLQQAVEHIKRLEQTNYALRVHLQSTGSSSDYSCNFEPPNVF